MKVVIERDGYKFRIGEFIEEKPKTYKVKRIDLLKMDNWFWGSQMKKENVCYVGELSLPVAELIDGWNIKTRKWSEEKDELNKKYRDIFENIVLQIKEL